MNTNPTNELFRLSAILYADNNYEVSPKTTHRKIIESALIENGNQFITIPNLCIYINATYELVFSEDEINDIIKSPKNSVRKNSLYLVKQYWNGTIKISNITMHSVWQWTVCSAVSKLPIRQSV